MADQLEILKLERTDAWYEYLHDTRGQQGAKYEKIEPWAWARLKQRLRLLASRERELRSAA